jgi:hypothetical protein
MVDLGPDKAQAFAMFAELVGKLTNSGTEPIAPQTANGAIRRGTVAELVPAYLSQLDVKPKTVVDYRCNLGWWGGSAGRA